MENLYRERVGSFMMERGRTWRGLGKERGSLYSAFPKQCWQEVCHSLDVPELTGGPLFINHEQGMGQLSWRRISYALPIRGGVSSRHEVRRPVRHKEMSTSPSDQWDTIGVINHRKTGYQRTNTEPAVECTKSQPQKASREASVQVLNHIMVP